MTRMQELKKALKTATSSVFDPEPSLIEYHGFSSSYDGLVLEYAGGWGDARQLWIAIPDPECDSFDVSVLTESGVILLEATVPLCALIAACDSMVRSRQAK